MELLIGKTPIFSSNLCPPLLRMNIGYFHDLAYIQSHWTPICSSGLQDQGISTTASPNRHHAPRHPVKFLTTTRGVSLKYDSRLGLSGSRDRFANFHTDLANRSAQNEMWPPIASRCGTMLDHPSSYATCLRADADWGLCGMPRHSPGTSKCSKDV